MKTPQRDANEAAMVKELRARGFLVQQLHQGDGVPDLIVAGPHPFRERGVPWGGRRLVLCEVKDPTQKPSARKLTPAQVRWHERWQGAPVFVVETVGDVVRIFGLDGVVESAASAAGGGT